MKPPPPINPALIEHARQTAARRQDRMADAITRFSGSMAFVYLHVIWFGCWIGLGIEGYPFGLLTMIVSLEAIFLSCGRSSRTRGREAPGRATPTVDRPPSHPGTMWTRPKRARRP